MSTNDQHQGYVSDSDISYKSSSSSDFSTSSSEDGNDLISYATGTPTSHLLSPPPSTGDTPLSRYHKTRSSSFHIHTPTSMSRPSSQLRASDSQSRARASSIASNNSMTIDTSDHATPRSLSRNNRSVTPILGPVNRSTIANEEITVNIVQDRPASNPRSGSAPRSNSRNQSRPSSNSRRDSRGRMRNSTPTQTEMQPSRIVGLGANLAVGTVLHTTALTALHEHRSHTSAVTQPRSSKQGPGHRKVRRWNNDKFIGIASDISHANPQRGMKIANIYAEAEMDKGKYAELAPVHNHTLFSTLNGIQDEEHKVKLSQKQLKLLKERFVDGEVVPEQDRQMTDAAKARLQKRQDALYHDGNRMMRENVNKRLLNVVMRACKSSGFTRKVVEAFEQLLVQNMAGVDDTTSSKSMKDDDIWEKVTVQKPFITKKGAITDTHSGVIIRLLFSEGESKGAFNRLLLHAVCQFHGLDTESNTTAKGYRMLIVTGLCKGCHLKFLDYVPFDDGMKTHVTSKSNAKGSANILADSMSALKVQ